MNSYVNTHCLALRASCFHSDPNAALTRNTYVVRSVLNPSPNHGESMTTITDPRKSHHKWICVRAHSEQIWLKNAEGTMTVVTINEDDLTDVLCAFLSPTRPYGYCFAYSGGAHKSLRGHFFFAKPTWKPWGERCMPFNKNTPTRKFMRCSVRGSSPIIKPVSKKNGFFTYCTIHGKRYG